MIKRDVFVINIIRNFIVWDLQSLHALSWIVKKIINLGMELRQAERAGQDNFAI